MAVGRGGHDGRVAAALRGGAVGRHGRVAAATAAVVVARGSTGCESVLPLPLCPDLVLEVGALQLENQNCVFGVPAVVHLGLE